MWNFFFGEEVGDQEQQNATQTNEQDLNEQKGWIDWVVSFFVNTDDQNASSSSQASSSSSSSSQDASSSELTEPEVRGSLDAQIINDYSALTPKRSEQTETTTEQDEKVTTTEQNEKVTTEQDEKTTTEQNEKTTTEQNEKVTTTEQDEKVTTEQNETTTEQKTTTEKSIASTSINTSSSARLTSMTKDRPRFKLERSAPSSAHLRARSKLPNEPQVEPNVNLEVRRDLAKQQGGMMMLPIGGVKLRSTSAPRAAQSSNTAPQQGGMVIPPGGFKLRSTSTNREQKNTTPVKQVDFRSVLKKNNDRK